MDDDRPFGYDTLKLRAVFVPQDNPDKISPADITAALGYDAVKIPAIFVPDGSDMPRPGYPYVHVGRYVMRGDGEVDMLGPVARRRGRRWVGRRPDARRRRYRRRSVLAAGRACYAADTDADAGVCRSGSGRDGGPAWDRESECCLANSWWRYRVGCGSTIGTGRRGNGTRHRERRQYRHRARGGRRRCHLGRAGARAGAVAGTGAHADARQTDCRRVECISAFGGTRRLRDFRQWGAGRAAKWPNRAGPVYRLAPHIARRGS